MAQGEGNVWYFGNKAGLSFNSGNPVALTNGQVNTLEGVSGISDPQGNLQFYTNGVKVWNKNHLIMDNGTGLFGDPSSSQSAVVVRKPNSANQYYIFTTNTFETNGGFRYSVVDMSANGNFGAVTEKNVLLSASTCEKISVVRHQNGTDFWVITHLWGNDGFLAHQVSASGISNSPVVSNAGFSIIADNDHANAIGYMKVSPDGTKLAVCHTYMNKAQLFDFDDATGVVSNPRTISASGFQPYGVEFSPNGQWLYMTSVQPKRLLRYDLQAADIQDSQTVLSEPSTLVGALQMGPDGKIYMAMAETDKLSVISNPDNSGSGCSVLLNAVDLAGRLSMLGLPAFNQSLFNTSIGIANTCLGNETSFSLQSAYEIQTAFWDFGDGTTSSEINPTHVYSQVGNYTVTVTAGNNLFTLSRSKNFNVSASPIAYPVQNQWLCVVGSELYYTAKNDAALLGPQSAAQYRTSYYASLADAQQDINPLPPAIPIATPGVSIFGRVSNLATGCFDITSFTVSGSQAPTLPSVSDFEVCDAPFDGFADFDLFTKDDEILAGLNGPYEVSYHETVEDADLGLSAITGIYQNQSQNQLIYARVTNTATGCYALAQFALVVSDCTPEVVYTFPTFFTPNGDGYNDTWKLDDAPPGTVIRIFDRYGKLLFEIKGTNGWDGTISGRHLPSDDYWFVMTAPGINELRGHFALKR